MDSSAAAHVDNSAILVGFLAVSLSGFIMGLAVAWLIGVL